MWLTLQQKKPDDYVIATGKQISIKQFVNLVSKKLKIKLKWSGKGVKEKALDVKSKKIIIECDNKYFRPLDVENLIGSSKKAKKILKWKPKIKINQLIDEMIDFEVSKLKNVK